MPEDALARNGGTKMLRAEYEARKRGKTQTAIGKHCGVSASLISRVFRGDEKAYPKLQRGIASALDWPQDRAAELFEEITEVR